jgi:hypothetical protein
VETNVEATDDLKPKLRQGLAFIAAERDHDIPPYFKSKSRPDGAKSPSDKDTIDSISEEGKDLVAVSADAPQPVTNLPEVVIEPVGKDKVVVAAVASRTPLLPRNWARESIGRKSPFEV